MKTTVQVANRQNRPLLGIGLSIMAFLFLTMLDASAKWLIVGGMATAMTIFVRMLGQIVMVMIVSIPRHGLSLFVSKRPKLQLARGSMLMSTTVCNFIAVAYLPLTITGAIFFTVPLWICALSVPMLGERVGVRRWIAVIIGFVGVLIATQPFSEYSFHWALFFSFGAALSVALYSLLTRKLAGEDSTDTQQFYGAIVGTVVMFPLAVYNWQLPDTGWDWFALCLVAILGWTGHQFLVIAHRMASAATLAPFNYTQILWMGAASWLLFNQPPDLWMVTGTIVAIASGLYIWRRERILAAQVPNAES